MELCRVAGLLGLLHQGTRATHSSRNGGSPSLLPPHARWIDVVDMRVQPPLVASGVLRGLDGKKGQGVHHVMHYPGHGF
jgi:hypothetical protein